MEALTFPLKETGRICQYPPAWLLACRDSPLASFLVCTVLSIAVHGTECTSCTHKFPRLANTRVYALDGAVPTL